jgi:peptidoglycan/LPS O-acetylase OafA/YrhL
LLLPQNGYPILAPGWTLVYEIFFYLVFSILFFIPKRFCAHFLIGWGVLTIALYTTQNTDGMSNTNDLVQLPIYASPMTLEFLAGCLVGFLYNRRVKRFGKAFLAIGTVLFVAGGWMVESYTDLSTEFGLTRVLVFGTASALVLYGFLAAEQNGNDKKLNRWITNKTLVNIGDASYSLYLSHLLVINAFAIIWSRIAVNHWYIQAFYELVVLTSCIGFAIITFNSIERPILARLRRCGLGPKNLSEKSGTAGN